jgi:hypothetical protein
VCFDWLSINGKALIPFVVSWSNHEWKQLVQSISWCFPLYKDVDVRLKPAAIICLYRRIFFVVRLLGRGEVET